jgi:hypothetical protein
MMPILAGQDGAIELELVHEQTEAREVATKAVPKPVEEVLRLLDKRKKSISAFEYQPEACANFESEDVRVTVIKSVTLKKTPSDYFRAGLSALSLADDFTHWQGKVGGPRRLDVLYNDVSDKTGAVYRAYADTCAFIEDKEMAAEFIEFGIKLRYFEMLCWVRYRGPKTYNCSEAISSFDLDAPPYGQFAIIYPFLFVWRNLYRCRYADLAALASAILSDKHWRELAERKDWQPIDWQALMARKNGKRTFADRPSQGQSKRRREFLRSQPASENPLLLSHNISASEIQTLGPRLYPEEAQHITTRSVWPLGCNLFPNQPQDLTTRDIFPVGPTIFPDLLRTTPTPDPLTPGGLNLSTPELNNAVNNMLMDLNTNMNNPARSPT